MKTYSTFCLAFMLALISCSKSVPSITNEWSSISFTKSESSNYESYMDLPHINLTFPASVKRGKIDYDSGIWVKDGIKYVIIGHNWGNQEVLLTIKKDNQNYFEKRLTPLPDALGTPNSSIKCFSFNFEAEPGVYEFNISVIEGDGYIQLNAYPLHNSTGKMAVTF